MDSIDADSSCMSLGAIGEIPKRIGKIPDSGCEATHPEIVTPQA
jgi:hypothetical protein